MKSLILVLIGLATITPLQARDDTSRQFWTLSGVPIPQPHAIKIPDKGDQRRTDGGTGAKPPELASVQQSDKGDPRRVRGLWLIVNLLFAQ